MKKHNGIGFIIILALAAIFIFSNQPKKEAILNPAMYNGDMEDWCINTYSGASSGYGYLNEGPTKCNSSNSDVIRSNYDGLRNMNKMPLFWRQHYGCCIDRTTDAYSGTYAVLLHKSTTDDWYGLGMTKSGTEGYTIPASAERNYTITLYYKMAISTGRVPSLSFRFYNNLGAELQRVTKSFSATASYTYWNFVSYAPAGTVRMGWDIWIPPESLLDLYIDEMRIDEAVICSPGEIGQCGTNVGVCTFGTRTCQPSAIWGECTGNVKPSTETCGDSLDNNCNGVTDEGCTPYTKAELQQKFDTIVASYHGGQGTSDTNSPTYWAWDNAPIVEGLINMYSATHETRYLDSVVSNTDRLISKATIDPLDLSTATAGPLSTHLGWYALEHPIDPLLTYSRTLLPMVKFAYIVKRDNLAQYMAKADTYIAFVEDNFIPVYDGRWRECGDMGFWGEGEYSAPNNRASFVARIHLYLWMVTGKEIYHDKSIKYANKIKSTLLERTDGPTGVPFYFWNYKNKAGCTTVGTAYQCSYTCAAEHSFSGDCGVSPGSWSCSGPVEIGYGNYDIALMTDYYAAGIVFTSSDIQKLVNTFKEGILVTTAEVDGVPTPVLDWEGNPNNVPSTGNGPYSQTAQAPHWGRLGQYDTAIKTVFDKIVRFTVEHNEKKGSYYSAPYECVTDTRNGVKLCGTELTEGHRATPAYTTSMIGHQMLGAETLYKLTDAPVYDYSYLTTSAATFIGGGSFSSFISSANNWVSS